MKNNVKIFFQAEDTINVLTNLSNKKIGGKHVAVRYAKHMDPEDSKGSKSLPTTSSKASLADKKSKIQLIEEQLKNLQKQSDDFELNNEKTLTEPLIKKYQFNKDVKPTTSRHQSYYKKKRKPYQKEIIVNKKYFEIFTFVVMCEKKKIGYLIYFSRTF